MDICLKYDSSKDGIISDKILSPLFRDLVSFFSKNEIPDELVMFTVERYNPIKKKCEIIFILSENINHIGRNEKYSNCIFSEYADRQGNLVVVDDVKSKASYLELDPKVNSEMFFEYAVNDKIHIILNGEFSPKKISGENRKWLERIIGLLQNLT